MSVSNRLHLQKFNSLGYLSSKNGFGYPRQMSGIRLPEIPDPALSLNYLHSRIHLFAKVHMEISSTESTFLNLNILPHKQCIRCAAKIIEYLALDDILKEIMDSDAKSAVKYCGDFHKNKCTGSFTVQGAIIDGNYF